MTLLSLHSLSVISDLQFSPEQEELLQEEIAELDDAIACHVHVLDAVTQEIVGTASVQLWVMVEDSVNILRQVSKALTYCIGAAHIVHILLVLPFLYYLTGCYFLHGSQEVEVLNLDLSSEMGSALVDVKGFRLLKKCANAQRQRRAGR